MDETYAVDVSRLNNDLIAELRDGNDLLCSGQGDDLGDAFLAMGIRLNEGEDLDFPNN